MPTAEAALIRLDRTLREAQRVLRDYVVSGRSHSAETVVDELLAILDDEDFVAFQKSLEGEADSEPRPIGPEDPLPYR